MLIQIHKHMKWIMWGIVVLITITFLFFGMYPSDIGGRTVARVGGEVITSDDYNRVYRDYYERYRDVLKDQPNDTFAQSLKTQALQELIVNRMFVQEAERIGLRVADEELQASIMKMPAFSQGGQFNKMAYERILERINMTPAVFEASQKEMLLRQKLERLVRDGVVVTEQELAAGYKRQNPKAKPGEFEKNRESFGQTYLAGKQRDALTAYVRGIQEHTEIKIDEKSIMR